MWQGRGSRNSISNYMFNHIGHFAAACEALCKARFFGVTRRFPQLRCAFLECGVGWAASLYADMVGDWQKRNGQVMENYNPANLDRKLFLDLARRYGDKLVADKLDGDGEGWGIGGTEEESGRTRRLVALRYQRGEARFLLRLRGRRSEQRLGVRHLQATFRREAQRDLQFRHRPFGMYRI